MKWQFVVMYDHDIGVHVYLDKNRILDTGGRVKEDGFTYRPPEGWTAQQTLQLLLDNEVVDRDTLKQWTTQRWWGDRKNTVDVDFTFLDVREEWSDQRMRQLLIANGFTRVDNRQDPEDDPLRFQ